VLALLLAASFGIWKYMFGRQGLPRVAVLSFTNASHRPDDAWVSTALGDMLTAALRAGGGAQIVDRQAVSEAERDFRLVGKEPSPADFLQRLGADYVISGSFHRQLPDSELFTLGAALTRTTTLGDPIPLEGRGTFGNLANVVSNVADQVRDRLGLDAASRQQRMDLQALFPKNKPSLALYFSGVASLRSFEPSVAYTRLQGARGKEPENALIYRRLASAAWDLLRYDEAKALAAKARQLSAKLPPRERLEIEVMGLRMAEEWDKVIEVYRELHETEPGEHSYQIELAEAQRRADAPPEALKTFNDLLEERPAAPDHVQARVLYLKADTKDDLGESGEALDLIDQAAAKANDAGATYLMAEAQLLRSLILSRLGRYKPAAEDLAAAQRTFIQARDETYANICAEQRAILERGQGSRSLSEILHELRQLEETYRSEGEDEGLTRVLVMQSIILAEQGKLVESKARLDEAGNAPHVKREVLAPILVGQAYALVVSGKRQEAIEIVEYAEQNLGSTPTTATALASLAEILYYSGMLELAEDWQMQALKGHSGSLAEYDRFRLGMIHAAQGKPDGRDEVEEAYEAQNRMAESSSSAETALGLARLENLEGNFTRGADLAEGAERMLGPAGRSDLLALARATRAWALTCEGDKIAAEKALAAAKQRVPESQDFRVHFETRIAAARFHAFATQRGADSIGNLERIIGSARKQGFKLYELDARLALGEIKLAVGLGGQQDLNSLKSDASKAGFKQIERLAAGALEEGPVCRGRPTSLRGSWSRWLARILGFSSVGLHLYDLRDLGAHSTLR
jgi:tetratricopeptide (TPR) repeat protein